MCTVGELLTVTGAEIDTWCSSESETAVKVLVSWFVKKILSNFKFL